jgi:hypothetical protein
MSRRDDIQAEIEALQKKLSHLDKIGEDTFHFNTVLQFSAGNGLKWFIRKIDEETWVNIKTGQTGTLVDWILDSEEKSGPFEVYEMRAQPQPVYSGNQD